MQDAWLTGHGLARAFRFVLTILITVTVAVLMASVIVVGADREGCNRRQPIFKQLEYSINDRANISRDQVRHSKTPGERRVARKALAINLRRAGIVRRHIVRDCVKAYPSPIPLVEP